MDAHALCEVTMISLRIARWNADWRSRQDAVVCQWCDAKQTVEERFTVFIHRPGCPQAAFESYPWKELEKISEACRTLPH